MQKKVKLLPVDAEQAKRILEGRMTQIRRPVYPQPQGAHCVLDRDDDAHTYDLMCGGSNDGCFTDWCETVKPRYWEDDILAVQEPWRVAKAHWYESNVTIEFKAGGEMKTIQFPGYCSDSHCREEYDAFVNKWATEDQRWISPTAMPREAVRTYIRVTDVFLNQIQDITDEDIEREGLEIGCAYDEIWNKKMRKNRSTLGWEANPWVFEYTFEVISKEVAEND